MRALASFLPPHVVRRLKSGVPPKAGAVEEVSGAYLLSDIVGYTALSERLQSRGQAGAEEVAEILNAAFGPAIRILSRWRGGVVSFGGDALLTLFEGEAAVGRAMSAAAELQRELDRVRRRVASRGIELQLAQAVTAGSARGIYVGSGGRRHWVLVGAPVRKLARLGEQSEGGAIRVSRRARETLRREPPAERRRAVRPTAIPDALAAPFLPPSVSSAIASFDGGFRSAVILFLETRGSGGRRLNQWFESMRGILDDHDGEFLKTDLSSSGLKWLCGFGLSRAGENDADRGLRAALQMRQAAPSGIQLRAGLHQGVVAHLLIGSPRRQSFDVIGDAVNTAARAMSRASWGEVLVTDATRALLRGVLTARRGSHAVKGKAEPLVLHAVLGAEAAPRRPAPRTPMVGRQLEKERLHRCLKEGRDRPIGVVVLSGEAGTGKSRLREYAAREARALGYDVLQGEARAVGALPFHPLLQALREGLGVSPKEAAHVMDRRLAGLELSPLAHAQACRLLSGGGDSQASGSSVPAHTKIDALVELVEARARLRAQLLVIEDAQEADELTRRALEAFAASPSPGSVILGVERPSNAEALPANERIDVGELSREAVGELMAGLAGAAPTEAALDLAQSQARGNPLLLEELVAHAVATGTLVLTPSGLEPNPGVPTVEVSPSAATLIRARLDRLAPTARRVVRVAAVLGTRFDRRLLLAIEPSAEVELEGLLHDGILVGEEDHLAFRQALFREVAYEAELMKVRRRIHRQVAEHLDPDVEAPAALKAHHWDRAGDRVRARPCHLQAADQAARSFAYEQARSHFAAYFEGQPPAGRERVLARLKRAGMVYRVTGDLATADAEAIRALREARRLKLTRLEAEALLERGRIARVRGELAAAREFGETCLRTARREGDDRLVAGVSKELAMIADIQGRSEEAIGLYSESRDLYGKLDDATGRLAVTANLAVVEQYRGSLERARRLHEEAVHGVKDHPDRRMAGIVLSNWAIFLHETDRLDEAETLYRQSIAALREVGERAVVGSSLGNLANLMARKGDDAAARELYEQSIAITREVGDRRSAAFSETNLARALLEEGEVDEAAAMLQGAAETLGELGVPGPQGRALIHLSRLRRWCGELERARELLEQASRCLDGVDEPQLSLELCCERGHLALAQGDDPGPQLQAAGAIQRQRELRRSRNLENLQRAESERRMGRELFRGEVSALVPDGVKRWLEARGGRGA